MKIFLTAKHWQLFLVMFLIPVVLQFSFIIPALTESNPGPIIFAIPFLMIIYMIVLFLWYYTIPTQLHKRLPADVRININWFYVSFFFPLVYLIGLLGFVVLPLLAGTPELEMFANMIWIVIPLHLLAIFCVFYTLRFAAKVLRSVELKREAHFGDYAGEFFLFWFWFIGLWVIQPRLNRIVSEVDTSKPDTLDGRYMK